MDMYALDDQNRRINEFNISKGADYLELQVQT